MKNPQFYRALDQKVLFPWLTVKGKDYIQFTAWIYILIYLTSLFAVNTVVCTADKIYAIVKNKRPWQSFFPHIVHIGFLFALLGHLAGSVGGFRSYGNVVFKGEMTPVPHQQNLFIRLDDMEMKGSPEGELEELKTKVTLLDGKGTEIKKGDIQINGPLLYKGMAFYHLDQGSAPTGLVFDINGERVTAGFEGTFRSGDGSAFTIGQIYPDFAMDENGKPYSRSNNFVNPYIEISSSDGKTALLNISAPGTEARFGDKVLRLEDFVVTPYAVLSINKDPGIGFIIIGSIILVAGMVLLLFFRGERGELVRQRREEL